MTSFIRLFYAVGAATLMIVTTSANAQDGYRLKPGDVLAIEVLILPSGEFSFPFAGTVRAGGRTVSDIERILASGIASNFAAAPNVFASVRSLRPSDPDKTPLALSEDPETIDVFLLGEVGAPGTKKLKPGTTFLQALAQAGGLGQFAAKKRIQLRRTHKATGEQTLIKINYRALSRGAALRRDVVLQDGDVILVPERTLFE